MNNLLKLNIPSSNVKPDKIAEIYKREILDTRIAVADLARSTRVESISRPSSQEKGNLRELLDKS